MHRLLSVLAPHAFPRHNAVVLIMRVRVDVPLPQPLLQSDQAVQRDITQSRLLYREQDFVSFCAGQDLPPQEGWVFMFRVLVLEPVPHVVEQALHAVHVDTTQSTGQQLCLHERVCLLAGHATLQ